ncbi:MAG TPA: hypothetical protein VJQ82_26140 [Terriglobales bacterium]|nr:hypothetical protein [Terriglobales bacterium]
MRFRAAMVVLVFGCFLHARPRQEVPSQRNPGKLPKGKEIVSSERLLQNAYLFSRELPDDERAWLLAELTMPSAKWHPGLARPWAEEQFRIANQLSGYNRLAIQKNAATAMAWIDPTRALQLLRQCDTPASAEMDNEDIRGVAARTVFKRYWDKQGVAGLGRIESTADRIGDTGQYPYGAMRPLILEVSRRNPARGLTLIGEAVTYYGRGSLFQSADEEFIDFFKEVRGLMPPAVQREALEAAVKNLTKNSGERETQHWQMRVYTSKGVAEFHTLNAKLLFDILPMIREIDPDWAKRLVQDHAELAQTDAGMGKVLSQEGGVVMSKPDNPPSPAELATKEQYLMEVSRLQQIEEIAAKDPDQALTLAMSINDPARHAMGLAYAAAGFGNHPEQASQLLSQSQQSLSSMKRDDEKLEAFVAIAQSAASLHDIPRAREAVEKGLDLGEQVYEESRKQHPEWPVYSWEGQEDVQKLTELGTRIDAAQTVGRVEQIHDHALQAYLLIAASRALDEKSAGGWRDAFTGD